MAPEFGTLFDHLPVIPERILRKHAVHQRFDGRFRSAARLLQALWREDKALPVGIYARADGKTVRLGSRLAAKAGENGENFLSPNIAALAIREVAYREPGAMIDEERLFCNLLSSMPLVFNLFGPLRLDLQLATAVVARIIPDFDGTVTQVLFEHSPSRGDPAFTDDYTAFDVLIRYQTSRGQRGFVAFEVKYSESGREPIHPPKARYQLLSRDVDLFVDPNSDKLRTLPLQQLWREHCLAQTMIENGLYEEGTFVLIAPELNEPLQRMGRAYAHHLKLPDEHHVGFSAVSLETFIEAIRVAGAEQHASALHRRYCDFWLVDGEIELALNKPTTKLLSNGSDLRRDRFADQI